MIDKVTIRNWQSLRTVDIDLGRLTVIVGPSNSGKSAFIRALRALASNVRGSSAITRGAKAMAITVHTGQTIVTLERTDTSGLYRLVDVATGTEQVFTKLAGGVPAAVTAALGIEPATAGGVSLNFAGQLDRPYLLDDSGANVARELGELTNVTSIFEAVREANRRRNALAATLRTRETDLASLASQVDTFTSLTYQLAACDTAEKFAETVAHLTDRHQRLDRALTSLRVAEGVLRRTSIIPVVPVDTAVLAAQARLARLQSLIRGWVSGTQAATAAISAVDHATREETRLGTELHQLLVTAGTCPTCLRPMNGTHREVSL